MAPGWAPFQATGNVIRLRPLSEFPSASFGWSTVGLPATYSPDPRELPSHDASALWGVARDGDSGKLGTGRDRLQ